MSRLSIKTTACVYYLVYRDDKNNLQSCTGFDCRRTFAREIQRVRSKGYKTIVRGCISESKIRKVFPTRNAIMLLEHVNQLIDELLKRMTAQETTKHLASVISIEDKKRPLLEGKVVGA